jgi:hypothetical protein
MVLINPRSILWLYLVVPLAVLVAAFDHVSDGAVRAVLPHHPEDWWFWIYLFGMPHVFASFLLLADRDYWSEFRDKLVVYAFLFLILPYALLLLVGYQALFFLFTSLIIYHTIAQQFGIALVVSRVKPSLAHKASTFLASALGVIIYSFMYSDKLLFESINLYRFEFLILVYALLILVLALSVHTWRLSATASGRQMVIANAFMLVTIVFLFHYGLEVLSIIIARIIHEFTAWIVYSCHDANRNAVDTHNLVYQRLSFLGVPPYAIGLLLAVVLGFSFTYLNETFDHYLAMLVVSFSLYHYWIEGFIWKGRSGPKQNIGFTS